jgi:VanZ family protein
MNRKLLLLFAIAILLYATLIPGSGATGLPYVDKIAHFILFFFMTWNVVHCFLGSRYYLLLIGICIALAPLTEIAQIYIPRRSFEYLDILADLIGVFMAILIYRPQLAKLYSLFAK